MMNEIWAEFLYQEIRGCELVMTKGHRQQAAKFVFAAKPSTCVESRQSFP